MKKGVVLLSVLVLLFAACGKSKEQAGISNGTGGGNTALNTGAGSSSAPGTSGKPKASSAASKSKTSSSGSQGPTSSTPKPASQGGSNQPKDGNYVYNFSGTGTSPLSPTPQSFSGTMTKKITHDGNVVTEETTTDQAAQKVTQKTRWEATRVLFLSINIDSPQGSFNCIFNPPLLIAHIPAKAESIPTQHFKGSGNACNGTLDLTFVQKESVKDATGRSWSTWKVHVKTTVDTSQFSNTGDDMRWISPDLGEDVRESGSSQTTLKGTAGAQKFGGTSSSALKSHP